MSYILQKRTFIFILIMILFSCNNVKNNQQLKRINKLEKVTELDQNKLQSLAISEIEKKLKIAEFNLLKFERKKLDSTALELIYVEYKNYINCVNTLYESMQSINEFHKILTTNIDQLKNIKVDCQNSALNEEKLDKYLQQEDHVVFETSKSINRLVIEINYEASRFDTLNQQMENIIN